MKTIPGHPQYTLGPTLALNPMGFNQDFESKYALSPQQQRCCVLVLKLKHKDLLKCLVLLKSAFFLQIGILLFTKKPVTNLMKNVSVLFYECYIHSFQLMKEWRGLVFQICPMGIEVAHPLQLEIALEIFASTWKL